MAQKEVELEENCNKLDIALAQYYKSFNKEDQFYPKGKECDSIFAEWVEEEGFDDELLEGDLDEDPKEATVVEFHIDENQNNLFPLRRSIDDKIERAKEILSIIRHCCQTGQPPPTNAFDAEDLSLKVQDNEIKKVIQLYKKQVPLIAANLTKEPEVMYFLAATNVNNGFPVLQMMVDSFTRDRVQQKAVKDTEPMDADKWLEKNLLKMGQKKKAAIAVKQFCKRIVPLFQFKPINLINDQIADIANYVAAVSQLIGDFVKKSSPFQVDLAISVKGINEASQMESPDSEPDEKEEEEEENDDDDAPRDPFDVKKRLNKENCANVEQRNDKFDINSIINKLKAQFDKFKQENDVKSSANYPSKRRFVIFVERGKKKGSNDEIIMFNPPKVCNTIPENHVIEWYFESIRKCLVPRVGFGDGSSEQEAANTDNTQQDTVKTDVTITSQTAVKGRLMTFSFHVEDENTIKCYMYWMGQSLRFYPQDICHAFKFIFIDKQYKQFKKDKNKVNEILKQIHIRDTQYEKFYKSLHKGAEFPLKAIEK